MIMSFKMHWRTVDLGYCSSFYMNCRAHKKCLFAKNNRYSKNIWNLWFQNLTCFHGTLVQYAQACQCWMKDLVWCWELAPEIHLHQENPGQWTIWNWLSRCQGSSKCPCLTFNCWPCFLSLLALCLTSSSAMPDTRVTRENTEMAVEMPRTLDTCSPNIVIVIESSHLR